MSILIKGVEFLQGDLPLKLYVWSDGQAEVRNYDGSSTAAEAVFFIIVPLHVFVCGYAHTKYTVSDSPSPRMP